MPLVVGQQNIRVNRVISSHQTQSSHGFTVGAPVAYNGSNWVLAKADAISTGAMGLVYEIIDTNTFTYLSRGAFSRTTGEWDAFTGGTGGLVAGNDYCVSQSTAGDYELNVPSSGIVQFMFRAISTTEVEVYCAPPRFTSWAGTGVHDIGVGYGSSIVLDTTCTPTSLQAALNNHDYVYLQPGQYGNFSSVAWAITIPNATHLIGIGLGYSNGYSGSGSAYFTLYHATQNFLLNSGGSIQNLSFLGSTTPNNAYLIECDNDYGKKLVKNCFYQMPGGTTSIGFIRNQYGSLRAENCTAYGPGTGGTYPVFHAINMSSSDVSPWNGFYNCRIGAGTVSGTRTGFSVEGGGDLVSCMAYQMGGHGFLHTPGALYNSLIQGCNAYNCGTTTSHHGFHITGSSNYMPWTAVVGCKASICSGYGFYMPTGLSTSHAGTLVGTYAASNAVGAHFFNGSFINQSNYNT